MGSANIAVVVGFGQLEPLPVDGLAQLQHGPVLIAGLALQTKIGGAVDLTGPGAQQSKDPAARAAVAGVANAEVLQWETEWVGVANDELVGDHRGQKVIQPLVDDALLARTVAVPGDDLVGKALAAATDAVADTGRAYPDAGGRYAIGQRAHGISSPLPLCGPHCGDPPVRWGTDCRPPTTSRPARPLSDRFSAGQLAQKQDHNTHRAGGRFAALRSAL